MPTFNDRAATFWLWFEDSAPRLFATIERGQCDSLSEETSARVSGLKPGLCWVYGPGPTGHSLTVTGEGNEHLQLLTLQWCSRAPVIAGWTFYAARQAGPIKGHVIEMEGVRFDPKEIWVTPAIDREREKIDVTVWHPSWATLDPNRRSTVVFLFLDEALGEYGTDWWIGQIDFGRDRLSESFPLEELAGYVATVARDHGWKKHPPGEVFTLLSMKEDAVAGDFPRGDIRTQLTSVPRLFQDYMKAEGALTDPLAGSGADYVYVSIARSYFPAGAEVQKRGEIEAALEAALKAEAGGRCLGGATGTERCYVDLLIFDGAHSLATVKQTLRGLGIPAGTMIEFFAREKRAQRIAL